MKASLKTPTAYDLCYFKVLNVQTVILNTWWYQELIANTGALKEGLTLKVMVTKMNMININY